MIKISIDGFKKKTQKLKKIPQISSKTLEKVAKEGVGYIKVRTSRGYGVAKLKGNPKKFTPLKDSTIANRKRYKNKLVSGISPKTSALTFTQQMIKSISSKVKDLKATLFFKDPRRGSTITNSELAQIHEKGGPNLPKRPFFNFTRNEFEKLKNVARRDIKDNLKKLF